MTRVVLRSEARRGAARRGVLRRLGRWAFAAALALVAVFGLVLAYDSSGHAVSTLMVGRWLRGAPVERIWTPLREVSPHLVAAVVMSEDGQFCTHDGVDWAQLRDVMDDPDGPSRGASTITMQVARNLFLWNGRSFIRKGMEIPLALLLDALWTKKRLLEVYLNIAEWGDGLFGAQAAARHAFNKTAAQVSPREAALLATALPNPFLRNPAHPTRTQRELVAIDLARMAGAAPWTACLR